MLCYMQSSLGCIAMKRMLWVPGRRYTYRCYHCRPEGWVSWKGWILWIVTWLPIHLQHLKKKKKFNSTTSAAWKLVAGERDGNRSWNTPSGFCSMRCNSSCLSVCLSEHMLTFSYKRDMVVFFINWTSVIALSEHIFTQFYQITLCQ